MKVKFAIDFVEIHKSNDRISYVNVEKDWQVEELDIDTWKFGLEDCVMLKYIPQMFIKVEHENYTSPLILEYKHATHDYLAGVKKIDLRIVSFNYKVKDCDLQFLFVPNITEL